jgi:BASS family bile acid:Na+ symporter
MLIKAKRPRASARMEKPVKIASAIFLLLVIIAAVLKERSNLVDFFKQVGLAALVFNLASMVVGYSVPLLIRLPKRQATAIGMEIGIHNGTLAIAVASSPLLLNNTTMAIPPAIYSLIMFFTAGAFGSIVARGNAEEAGGAAKGA